MRLIDADALNRSMTTLYRLCRTDKMTALLGRVLFIISKAPTVCGWISVKDRLPEKPDRTHIVRKWYLVALESGCVMDLAYDFTFEQWSSTASPVTHWMELPDPPKGVSESDNA